MNLHIRLRCRLTKICMAGCAAR